MDERNTAIHEAGHAVAAFYLHQRIRRATIVPRADSLGHVAHFPVKFADQGLFDDSRRGIDRAEKRVVILYAGPLASRKLAPRSRWRRGGSWDFEGVRVLMSHLQGNDDKYNTLYAKLIWRRAELLVEHRWKDICAVADALLEHRTLYQAGICAAILRAHRAPPERPKRSTAGASGGRRKRTSLIFPRLTALKRWGGSCHWRYSDESRCGPAMQG